MISMNVLPNWHLAQTADGVILTPPEGAELGAIRIRESQRPLVVAAQLFAGNHGESGPLERMVTCEGELAVMQAQRGTGPDGKAFARCVGAVFGDDVYTLIEASTTNADRFAFFEQAARTFTFYMSLGLGYRRLRRFEYTPPVAWAGVARGLDAVWLPPGFPGVRAQITVHAAQPVGATSADLLDATVKRLELSGLANMKVGDPERRYTTGGLIAVTWRATGSDEGTRKHVDVVVLEDERFLYPLELIASGELLGEMRTALDVVIHSTRSVPLPPPQPPADPALRWPT